MARVLLATIGSLGDLHPFIAIGRALVARGDRVVLGVPADGVAKATASGLDAAPILPSYTDICRRLGLTEEQTVARIVDDPGFVMNEVLMPSLDPCVRALDELAANADVIAASIFAFAAGIVAERRNLPLAAIVLQPMTLMSAWQPPVAPRFGMMRHDARSWLGRGWNRAVYAAGRAAFRRRYAAAVDAVRRDNGLPASRAAPLLDPSPAIRATLCGWSPVLGALPPDAPSNAALVGFSFFDSEHGGDEPIPAELGRFLDEGEPPLVFTLGSVAVASTGRFYDEAAAAAQALGQRAILLDGRADPPRRDGDCLVMEYAPHSAIFPRAAAVIHHGGVGTMGQPLRAVKPQLVVLFYGDQFDNAARVHAAGLGATIGRKAFRAPRVANGIGRLLQDRRVAAAAVQAGRQISGENGALTAAAHIAALC